MSLSIDEIRKKKLAEMQAQAGMQQDMQQQETFNQLAQLEAELKVLMPKILTSKALERLSIIKSTKQDFAMQVQLYLVSLQRQGHIKEPMSDEKFKELLDNLVQKPKWNIKRR